MTSALYDWLSQTASSRSDSLALTFLRGSDPTITYTYGELFDRVERIGESLKSEYDDRSAPLGLLMASQEDQVLHYLAGLHAGVIPAILTPPNRKLNRDYYRETMATVLARCQFGAVVSDVEDIELSTRGLRPYTFKPQSKSQTSSAPVDGEALNASFMQFSSGTTGIKRGVLVEDEAVIAQLETYAKALNLVGDDVILSWLPLYHDMGFIACLNMPLAFGLHTVMIDPIDWVSRPSTYLRAVSEYRATLSWHPNFAFAFMAQRVSESDIEGVDLSSLRGLINCSEPVTYESQQAFAERFSTPHGLSERVFKGCYAMAETTFALTHGEPDDPQYLDSEGPSDETKTASPTGYVSVGHPLPGVELTIRDPESHAELPDREVGEIWVRSPFNFTGYYNEPEATAEAFVEDWYRTGDLGYRVGTAFYVAGRLKDVLIVGGVNVFPQDIEDLVSNVSGVVPGRVSAFSTFDDKRQTEHVVILAETEHENAAERQQTTLRIRQEVLAAFQLANFEIRLVEPGWLVKSTSGKMARGANREKWLSTRRQAGN